MPLRAKTPLDKKSPIQGASGSNREAESTDAPERGGLPRSSAEAGVMPVERRGQVIAVGIGSTGIRRSPILDGRRQPSCGDTSRMMRDYQVRICERLGVKFPGPTRHNSKSRTAGNAQSFSLMGIPGLLCALVPKFRPRITARNGSTLRSPPQ